MLGSSTMINPDFYPRSPCGERQHCPVHPTYAPVISIHALLAESDTPRLSRVVPTPIFLSTLSLRRATVNAFHGDLLTKFLSTLSLRRATSVFCRSAAMSFYFYPRSPCGERPQCRTLASGMYGFLSTLSLRRATTSMPPTFILSAFLSTLSLRRATGILGRRLWHRQQFLSTLSLRRATPLKSWASPRLYISIHALLAESDVRQRRYRHPHYHFYPRSPCGERPIFAVRPYDAPIFLSTLSLRRATLRVAVPQHVVVISIHALLAESDQQRTER